MRAKLNHQLKGDGKYRVLWEFYRELLRLRQEVAPLAQLSKEHCDVIGFDNDRVLLLRRWQRQQVVVTPIQFQFCAGVAGAADGARPLAQGARLERGALGRRWQRAAGAIRLRGKRRVSFTAVVVGVIHARQTHPKKTSRSKTITMKVWPGKPYPLGATWDGAGINFAIFSENATASIFAYLIGLTATTK